MLLTSPTRYPQGSSSGFGKSVLSTGGTTASTENRRLDETARQVTVGSSFFVKRPLEVWIGLYVYDSKDKDFLTTRAEPDGKLATKRTTRMVQLPATAAIEYVAACWMSGAGRLLSGGASVRGGVFCPFPPSSMRIRTV